MLRTGLCARLPLWRIQSPIGSREAQLYTQADYAAMLAVNLTGFFHITQLAVADTDEELANSRFRGSATG
jgi:hypothetical protein